MTASARYVRDRVRAGASAAPAVGLSRSDLAVAEAANWPSSEDGGRAELEESRQPPAWSISTFATSIDHFTANTSGLGFAALSDRSAKRSGSPGAFPSAIAAGMNRGRLSPAWAFFIQNGPPVNGRYSLQFRRADRGRPLCGTMRQGYRSKLSRRVKRWLRSWWCSIVPNGRPIQGRPICGMVSGRNRRYRDRCRRYYAALEKPFVDLAVHFSGKAVYVSGAAPRPPLFCWWASLSAPRGLTAGSLGAVNRGTGAE